MFTHHRPKAILMAFGLWFIVIPSFCQAGQAHVQAKAKSLAHYIMAVMDDLNGDEPQAMKGYQQSIKFNARQPMPHLRLATYYVRFGRTKEAIAQLKTVIKLQPDSSQAHYLLALVYSSQKKYNLAASEYELVLKAASKHNPESIEVHVYLAQLYYALHKYPQAIDQLNHILQSQPKNVSALFLLGSIHFDSNKFEKAKECFHRVLSIEPEHAETLNAFAYMYAEQEKNLDEALKMARKAVVLNPSNGAYYDTLGWVLFKKGMNAEGLMALEKAQNYIINPVIYEHMGDVYHAVNEPALARKFWLKTLSKDPKQPHVSLKLQGLNKTSAQMQEINYNPTQ